MDNVLSLPFIFAALMGVSILIYVILDGFDLGVGILFGFTKDKEKQDAMVSSIGPFWDANETWLVLAVGLLLVAFPTAHSLILTALYLPVFLLLVGLILRGISFEFRAKADVKQKVLWDAAFFFGSLLTTLSQGFMLGLYIMGLEFTGISLLFASLTAICVTAGYALIGATWLILKTDGSLQQDAIGWAKRSLWFAVLGMISISIVTPIVDNRIFDNWFKMPNLLYLSPLPILSALVFAGLWIELQKCTAGNLEKSARPFLLSAMLFLLAFIGLAYSFYPYVVPGQLTIYEAAAAPSSLKIILVGALFVLPMILGYTALSYYVFRGKLTKLTYN